MVTTQNKNILKCLAGGAVKLLILKFTKFYSESHCKVFEAAGMIILLGFVYGTAETRDMGFSKFVKLQIKLNLAHFRVVMYN